MSNRTARYHECVNRLCDAGILRDDAISLRRIAMTLHSWHELECGRADYKIVISVERDESTGKTYIRIQSGCGDRFRDNRYPTPDRESAALRRLESIMAQYPTLSSYVQGDPRGATLYILRPGDVPAGESPNAFYNRGVAVYK